MLTALDVAKCFINIFNDTEDGISNLKLQKLLYFAQGFSFQRLNRPLFNDEIEAWEYGPVINSVYQEFKYFGREPIRQRNTISLLPEEERLILDVAREYGKYTGNELINITHEKNTPWDKVYDQEIQRRVIPKDLIKEYFICEEKSLAEFDINDVIGSLEEVDLTNGKSIPLGEWAYE